MGVCGPVPRARFARAAAEFGPVSSSETRRDSSQANGRLRRASTFRRDEPIVLGDESVRPRSESDVGAESRGRASGRRRNVGAADRRRRLWRCPLPGAGRADPAPAPRGHPSNRPVARGSGTGGNRSRRARVDGFDPALVRAATGLVGGERRSAIDERAPEPAGGSAAARSRRDGRAGA